MQDPHTYKKLTQSHLADGDATDQKGAAVGHTAEFEPEYLMSLP